MCVTSTAAQFWTGDGLAEHWEAAEDCAEENMVSDCTRPPLGAMPVCTALTCTCQVTLDSSRWAAAKIAMFISERFSSCRSNRSEVPSSSQLDLISLPLSHAGWLVMASLW